MARGGNGDPFEGSGVGIFGGVTCDAVVRPGRGLKLARQDEPLFDAVNRMWWGRVGALPVLEDGVLVGRLAEDDLLQLVAERLEKRVEADAEAREVRVWTETLLDTRVADAMTPRQELALVPCSANLLSGLEQVCRVASNGTRSRYLFLTNDADRPERENEVAGILSFRDVARFLTGLYDGALPEGMFKSAEIRREAESRIRRICDQPLGVLREKRGLGHDPVVVKPRLNGIEAILEMWKQRRGYVLTCFPDGAPMGICTRRDVLYALSRPHTDLAGTALAAMSTGSVHTTTADGTLFGLFKQMAIEEFRHMPVVDDWDRTQYMVSLWEGVSLVAGFETAY